MVERRKYIRKSGSLEVSYQLVSDLMKSNTFSVNVSGAGIRIATRKRFDPETILNLEICSKETGGCIRATGKVVWTAEKKGGELPYEVGIGFLKISPGALDTLEEIIKKLGERKSDDIMWI